MDGVPGGIGSWIVGGAALAAFGSVWGYLRTGWTYLVSVLIVQQTIDTNIAWAVAEYANVRWRRSPYGPKAYQSNYYPLKKTRQHVLLAYERLNESSLFWRGWRPLRLSTTKSKDSETTTLTCIRGTFDIEGLIAAAMKDYNELRQGVIGMKRFRVQTLGGTWSLARTQIAPAGASPQLASPSSSSDHGKADTYGQRPIGWSRDEVGVDGAETCCLEDLALSPEAIKLLTAIRRWHASRDWYRKHRVVWKLGARLIGEPGCGKTAFIRGVAFELDLPVFMLDLATMTNDDLRDAWRIAMGATPCVVLIEDIDAVFDLDVPKHKDMPLTLDTLRQCMDGVQQHDGVLTFITTNKPETLDPSLKRAGRTDFELEMRPPGPAGLRKIAERICDERPELLDELVAKHGGMTGAAFQHTCTQIAVRKLFEDLHDGEFQTEQAPQTDATSDQQLRPRDQRNPARGSAGDAEGSDPVQAEEAVRRAGDDHLRSADEDPVQVDEACADREALVRNGESPRHGVGELQEQAGA